MEATVRFLCTFCHHERNCRYLHSLIWIYCGFFFLWRNDKHAHIILFYDTTVAIIIIIVIILFVIIWGLTRWFSSQGHLLLWEKIQVWFSVPTLSISQPFVISNPENLILSSVLHGYLHTPDTYDSHRHTLRIRMHTHTYK